MVSGHFLKGGIILNRKYEILEAAVKSFTLFGYKATSIDQVAKIANVGKGTIYNFFSSKEELLQEAVVAMIREMKIEVDATLDSSRDFMENAHTGLMKLLKYREKHLLYAKLLEEEKQLQTPAVKIMLQKIEAEIVSYVAGRIQNGIDKNEVNPCNPEHVAFLLLKSYLAFVVDWQNTREKPMQEHEILALFKETIFRGMQKI